MSRLEPNLEVRGFVTPGHLTPGQLTPDIWLQDNWLRTFDSRQLTPGLIGNCVQSQLSWSQLSWGQLSGVKCPGVKCPVVKWWAAMWSCHHIWNYLKTGHDGSQQVTKECGWIIRFNVVCIVLFFGLFKIQGVVIPADVCVLALMVVFVMFELLHPSGPGGQFGWWCP